MAEKNNVFMNGLNGDNHAAPEPISEKAGRRSLSFKTLKSPPKRRNPPAEPMNIKENDNPLKEQKTSKELTKTPADHKNEKPSDKTQEEQKTGKKASGKPSSEQSAKECQTSQEHESKAIKDSAGTICQPSKTTEGKSQEPEDKPLPIVPVESEQSSNLESGVEQVYQKSTHVLKENMQEDSNQEYEVKGQQTEKQINTPTKVSCYVDAIKLDERKEKSLN